MMCDNDEYVKEYMAKERRRTEGNMGRQSVMEDDTYAATWEGNAQQRATAAARIGLAPLTNEMKLDTLLSLLHTATLEGRIRWESWVLAGIWQAEVSCYSVQIVGGEAREWLRILDEKGRIIEEFDVVEWEQFLPGYRQRQRDLFVLARRQAMDADRAIDEVIALLKAL